LGKGFGYCTSQITNVENNHRFQVLALEFKILSPWSYYLVIFIGQSIVNLILSSFTWNWLPFAGMEIALIAQKYKVHYQEE
jgi:hypothetical protein